MVLEKTLESPLYSKEIQPVHPKENVLNILWKDWCWSWNSNTLVTWCEELTHWQRSWCWEWLKVEEGDDSGWDCWMASLTQLTWVWVSSRCQWWTWKPGILQSMGSQRVVHNWAPELNWTFNFQKKLSFLNISGFPLPHCLCVCYFHCWYFPRFFTWLTHTHSSSYSCIPRAAFSDILHPFLFVYHRGINVLLLCSHFILHYGPFQNTIHTLWISQLGVCLSQ